MLHQPHLVTSADLSIEVEDLFTEKHYEAFRSIFMDRPDVGKISVTCPVPKFTIANHALNGTDPSAGGYAIVLVLDIVELKRRVNIRSVMEDLERVLDEVMSCSVEIFGKLVRYH